MLGARARRARRSAAVALAALVGLGCSDARGRFEEFERRRGDADFGGAGQASGDGGAAGAKECAPPAPGVVRGPALLALETATTPGKAILFFGEVDTPELEGRTSVVYRYKALDARDRRTELGEPLVVGPYPIGDDGKFDAPTAKAALPGGANALLPGVEIVSELTLHGTICGASEFYCGVVSGHVYEPFDGPATGQFGLLLVDSIDEVPARPRFGCAEDALAPALE
jgi:hypothetical protein